MVFWLWVVIYRSKPSYLPTVLESFRGTRKDNLSSGGHRTLDAYLWPDDLKVSKSMRSLLAKDPFRVTADHAFEEVILACKNHKRKDQDGTWITDEMQWAYQKLHLHGAAHSIEVWKGAELIAGLYGLSLGKVFFGESMFTKVSNGSKYAFIKLVRKLKEGKLCDD